MPLQPNTDPDFEIRYRIVHDYGYSDKTWVERHLLPDQLVEAWNRLHRWGKEPLSFEEILAQHSSDEDDTHFVEEDAFGDEEDWDWMDS